MGITRQQFEEWAKTRGWKQDKFGHFHKIENGKEYRFKVSSTHVRHEVKVQYNGGGSDWVRLRGGYFKDLSFNQDNKLVGLK